MPEQHITTSYAFHELDDLAKKTAIQNMKLHGSTYSYAMSREQIVTMIEEINVKFTYSGEFFNTH